MEESLPKKPKKSTTLRALGFCGADDSVHPNLLGIISDAYPFVEFGVLFRPDKEGQPRYASMEWVKRLAKVAAASQGKMRLAAHFCGSRVNEVLRGDDVFVSTLRKMGGFGRIQINATAVNGVDTSQLGEMVPSFAALVTRYPELEFILQQNDETRPLWEGLLALDSEESGSADHLPPNVSMLVDESKGTGVLASAWPVPPKEYNIGYAGGIGPGNIEEVLKDIIDVAQGHEVWIDMESSLRSTKNGKDVFDLDKCYTVIDSVCRVGLHQHPSFLMDT